jgi:hypothetical protein
MRRTNGFLLAAAVALGAPGARADDGSGPPRGAPPAPPAEAIQACSGLADGAACGFTMGDHQLAGTCRTGPQGEPAACMPPRRHGPPPEAFAACQGLAAGDACTVAFQGQQVTGSCRAGPDGQARLACAPPRPPGR